MTDFQAAAIAAAILHAAARNAPFSEWRTPDPRLASYDSALRAVLEAMDAAHVEFAR